MIMQSNYNPTLDLLRIAGSIIVILTHVSGFYLFSTEIGGAHRWMANVFDSFSRWGVPIFIMISGILLLNPQKANESLGDFFTKRLHKVIVPYIVRNCIYFIVWKVWEGNDMGWGDFFLQIMNNGVYPYHLRFLSSLIGIYCTIPFLRIIIVHAPKNYLYLFCLGYICFLSINYFLKFISGFDVQSLGFTPNVFIGLAGYTVLGYVLWNDEYIEKKLSLPIVGTIFLLSRCVITYGTYILSTRHGISSEAMYQNGQFFVILISLSALLIAKKYELLFTKIADGGYKNTIKYFASLTLGVYIIHPLVMKVFTSGYVINTIFGHQGYLHYGVSLIGTIVCSFIVIAIIHRIPYIRNIIPA